MKNFTHCASIGRPIAVHNDMKRRHTKPADSRGRPEFESVNKGERKSQKDVRQIRSDKHPDKNSNVVHLRIRLHVGIIPNEQARRDLHQRLPALLFLKHARHPEHFNWKSF